MTVTEALMKPGSFGLKLRADAQWSKASAIRLLDHVIVTRGRLDASSGYSDATVLAASIYTGVITSKPAWNEIGGYGLEWWLGTPSGLGDLLDTKVSRSAGTLSQWFGDLLPSSLTVGTVNNTGLGALTNTYQFMTRREAIDAVCRSLGAERRVNHNGTVDAAAAGTLFSPASPSVLITRKEEGQADNVRGLQATRMEAATDVEEYTTKAIVVANGQGANVVTGSSTGSTTYKDLNGNTVVLERFVDAPSEPSANASTVAVAVVAQWNAVRRKLSLSSNTYNVTRSARPGDWVYAWDPLAELTDAANQVPYRGELVAPIKLRVYELTWPIEAGMGVYVRRSGSPATYVDITDMVEWETGDVTWDVGTTPRAANEADASTSGSTAFLGANPGIVTRTSPGTRQTYTPTFSNVTIGSGGGAGTVYGEYSVDVNGWCDFVAIFELGSGSAVSSGAHSVTLPVTCTGRNRGHLVAGAEDVGNFYYPLSAYADTSTANIYTIDQSGGYSRNNTFGGTVPFTWGTGDRLIVSGRYPT